jgi:RNA polymerase sigma factor (sigma-70 family)
VFTQQPAGDRAATRIRSSGTPLGTLLEGVARGDWTSWREITGRFGPLVLHTARGAGLSSADAADVAQQTWVLLWQHGHQIREPRQLASWLVVAARREAIRLATASNRYVLCADPETEYRPGDTSCATDTYPVEGEYDGALAQALDRLPPRYRTLLVLATSDLCLSYAEIAERMRLPIGSIGPMRMRALEMLGRAPELRTGRAPSRPALTAVAA